MGSDLYDGLGSVRYCRLVVASRRCPGFSAWILPVGAGLSRDLEFISPQLADLYCDGPLGHLKALLCDHALSDARASRLASQDAKSDPTFFRGQPGGQGFTDLLHGFDLPVTYENATGFTIPRQPDSHRRDGTAGSSHDGSITAL